MKISIGHLNVGDIYEHRMGGFWQVVSISNPDIISVRLNSQEKQTHFANDITNLWGLIFKEEKTLPE